MEDRGSPASARGGNRIADQEARAYRGHRRLGGTSAPTHRYDFDLEPAHCCWNGSGKVASDANFVFFNNLKSPDGFRSSTPATTSPVRRGDDEQIKVNLAAVPADIDRSSSRSRSTTPRTASQSFGQVRNAFIRVVNQAGEAEIARYDLSEDASTETAMVFGELYRNGAEWKFRAIGQGYASGLRGIAQDFGVNV